MLTKFSDDDPFPVVFPDDPPLTPGEHGKNCLGNGKHPEHECCCDNCDYFLICFPEYWDPEFFGETEDLEKS